MTLGLIESNATLRAMQKEKLAPYNPVFLEDFAHMPWLPVLAVANEFFDALPVRQFEKNFQGWCERLVAVEKGKLAFTPWPLNENESSFIPSNLRDAVPGTVYEISLPALAAMRAIAQHINRHGGAALIADYGYAEPFGKPSLQAVAKHQYADVLERPGEVDLTAHVDFSALSNMAAAQGTAISGPIGQGEFLKTLGMELRAIQLKQRATAEEAKTVDQALYRLTDPSQMGSLFKVMAVSAPQLRPLPGF
jgi:SAM-dependent MidA family methyltransferase